MKGLDASLPGTACAAKAQGYTTVADACPSSGAIEGAAVRSMQVDVMPSTLHTSTKQNTMNDRQLEI